ncbi:MAG: hypothetical protein J2P31_13845, partial [Blastocatellia bacterium]|nr:hypothetical protein [Blastocatellia bacterium]
HYLVGGSPQTRRHRKLAVNPTVCIHLESRHDVVILHGEALELRPPDRALAERLAEASQKRYGYGPKPEEYEVVEGLFVFQPRLVTPIGNFPTPPESHAKTPREKRSKTSPNR